MTTPDVAGPILAFRAWSVGPGRALGSTGQMGSMWPPRSTFEARCLRYSHRAPEPNCHCGIYATKDIELARTAVAKSGIAEGRAVVGVVELWGRVMPHEHGYRAELAEPKALVRAWEDEQDGEMADLATSLGIEIWEYPEFVEFVRNTPDSADAVFRAVFAPMAMAVQQAMLSFEEAAARVAQIMNSDAEALTRYRQLLQPRHERRARKRWLKSRRPAWADMNDPRPNDAFKK